MALEQECKIIRDRSDEFKSSVVIDADLDPIGSIPTTDMSGSDDEDNDEQEENDDNDDSSLGMIEHQSFPLPFYFEKKKKLYSQQKQPKKCTQTQNHIHNQNSDSI